MVALDEDIERDWRGEGASAAILAWNSLGSSNKLEGGSSGESAQRQNLAAAFRRLKYITCGAGRGGGIQLLNRSQDNIYIYIYIYTFIATVKRGRNGKNVNSSGAFLASVDQRFRCTVLYSTLNN